MSKVDLALITVKDLEKILNLSLIVAEACDDMNTQCPVCKTKIKEQHRKKCKVERLLDLLTV